MKSLPLLTTNLILGLILLAGCGQSGAMPEATAAGTAIPVVAEKSSGDIEAEAVVEPLHWDEIPTRDGGVVVEVLAQPGDVVKAGDVLVRFDAAEAALAVKRAEVALASAEAHVTQLKSSARPEELAVLEAQLTAMQARVSYAVAQRDGLKAGAADADVAAARAAVAAAEFKQWQAEKSHNAMMKCYDIPQPDGSIEHACPTLGTFEELTRFEMFAANDALAAAQAQLAAAEGGGPARQRASNAAAAAAVAQQAQVEAQLARLQAGTPAEQIAKAEALVQQAATALAQAEATLPQFEVRAPFDGVIATLETEIGDVVAPGSVLAVMGTTQSFHACTTDLTELAIVQIQENQPVTVKLEALPGQEFPAHVTRIGLQAQDFRGEVVYPVCVTFDEAIPELRWGMSAIVGITSQPAGDAAQSLAAPAELAATSKVIAEAVLEPARWSEVRFPGGGLIAETPVAVGDTVSAGDVLVQLDATDARLAVRAAEAALVVAQADLAILQAGPHPDDVARSQAALTATQSMLGQAAAQRDALAGSTLDAEIKAAQAKVAEAQAQQRFAQEQHDQMLFIDSKEEAQRKLYIANEALAAAQAQLAAVQGGSDYKLRAAQAEVWAASEERNAAQAQLDLLLAGNTPEQIAVAEVAVREAEIALNAAKLALERTTIRAPYSGVVVERYAEPGNIAVAGQPLARLATLELLQARTKDLIENDVARLAEGQAVVVTVDALPDRQFHGRVARIGLRAEDYRGDVVYPVYVALEENAPELRWGMTVLVEIEAP